MLESKFTSESFKGTGLLAVITFELIWSWPKAFQTMFIPQLTNRYEGQVFNQLISSPSAGSVSAKLISLISTPFQNPVILSAATVYWVVSAFTQSALSSLGIGLSSISSHPSFFFSIIRSTMFLAWSSCVSKVFSGILSILSLLTRRAARFRGDYLPNYLIGSTISSLLGILVCLSWRGGSRSVRNASQGVIWWDLTWARSVELAIPILLQPSPFLISFLRKSGLEAWSRAGRWIPWRLDFFWSVGRLAVIIAEMYWYSKYERKLSEVAFYLSANLWADSIWVTTLRYTLNQQHLWTGILLHWPRSWFLMILAYNALKFLWRQELIFHCSWWNPILWNTHHGQYHCSIQWNGKAAIKY